MNMRAIEMDPAAAKEILAVSCGAGIDSNRSRGFYGNGAKRVFDTCLILAAAPVVLPFILLMAMIIACDGANPFFAQKRVGQGGKVFRIWKLRTMVANAEDELAHYLAANPEARAEWERTQKLKSDPRVTWIGRFLRKTSMDELPQLFNVLRGDMSLVGPRPMMVEQRSIYPGTEYYLLRPGLTGLWQISGRSNTTYMERVQMDRFYVMKWNPWMDLRIIFMTIPAVALSRGAH